MEDRLLSIQEMADKLGVNVVRIRQLLLDGVISGYRVSTGRRAEWKFDGESVLAELKAWSKTVAVVEHRNKVKKIEP